MTKTLTEQWCEGTMESGMYYWKLPNNETFMATLYKMDEYKQTKDASQIVCLAPVPSYDKVKELVQKIHILNEQNTKQYNELCEEIKKNNILEKRLEIATKVLEHCQGFDSVSSALKEMEGVK